MTIKPTANRPETRRCMRRVVLGWVVVLLLIVLVPSCRRETAPVESPVTLPQAFSSSGDADLPDQWWKAFGDAELDQLIDQALRGNFSLRIAWDRLDQAQALAKRAGAGLRPGLDASFGASRSESEPDDAGGASRGNGAEYSLRLTAGYEVDLWGSVRSSRDAARLDAYASQEDVRAAAITLTAEVARAWYQLIERRAQLGLLDEQIETNEKYLEIITLRFRRGQGSATDVLQQRQLIESVKGERLLVESAAQVLEHRLAVLLGRSPGDATFDVPSELPGLPPVPKTGVPADLIRRRPDVRAAELTIGAADERVAVAIAAQFPGLNLSLSAETSADRIGGLFDAWLANLVAGFVGPIFDGGARRAEVERTRAVLSERVNAYAASVLAALQEVEDALAREAKQAAYVTSLHAQFELSEQATAQTLDNYTKGAVDFTRYLTTLLAHQRLQRQALQAEVELVRLRIDLYRALAGSWALERPQAPDTERHDTGNTPDDTAPRETIRPSAEERQ